MRCLGVDFGTVRTGLALGDTVTGIASPLFVIDDKHGSELIQFIHDIAEDEEIDTCVVGLPRPLLDQVSGETLQTQKTQEFIQLLCDTGLSVVSESETWSTLLAARQQHDAGDRHKRDDLAAAAILQTYLDRVRRS